MSRKPLSPLLVILLTSGICFVGFLLVSVLVFMNKSEPDNWKFSTEGKLFGGKGAVGVIELRGVIMDSKHILKKLKKFEDSEDIKAIVVRLDSPGGSVAPSQEIYEAVKAYKKPVVASMASVAASGAFYVAMGAEKVVANAGTLTGSIGVIMEFANMEKLFEWAKIKRYSLKTGRYKDSGASYRTMQPDEKMLLQTMLEDVLSQFKQAVKEGRKLSQKQVDEVADGRIFSGAQAKKLKLVDELGTLKDAVRIAGELGGIEGEPKVRYHEKRKRKLIDLLVDYAPDDDESESRSPRKITGYLDQAFDRMVSRWLGSSAVPAAVRPAGLYWLWPGFSNGAQ